MDIKEKSDLKTAFSEISYAENGFRRRIYLISGFIVILCSTMIFYTYCRVSSYSQEAAKLRAQKAVLLDSVNAFSKTLKYFSAFSEFSIKWDSTDICLNNPVEYRKAQTAHKVLMSLAKHDSLNSFTYIRYYLKWKDQYPHYNRRKESKRNRVQNSIRKLGYRFIDVRTDSYRSKIGTNVIHFSPGVSKTDLNAIALALIRAGIKLKAIQLYSSSTMKYKPNSIEIGTDDSLERVPELTIDEIPEKINMAIGSQRSSD